MKRFTSSSPLAVLGVILAICLANFFVINACRKTEHPDKSDPTESSVRVKFFTIPAGTNPIVKAISESIKRQDKQRDFVPELSKKAGFPVWEKAIIARGSATETDARLLGGGSSNEVILVPFVKGGKYFTNAILLVDTGDPGAAHRDSSYQLVYMSRYEDFGFDYSDTTQAGARNVFHLFTVFDNEIFGYTNFIVKDSRIITGRLKDTTEETPISLVNGPGTSYQNRLTSITYCNSYEICNLCGFRTTNRVTEGCRCGSTLATYCTTVWFETGSGGLGGGQTTGGGGGGGGGGNWENTNPCRTVPSVDNPCGSNPSGYNPPTAGPGSGWVPVTDDEVEGIYNFDTWDVSPEDFIKIKNWKANNIDISKLDSCRKIMMAKILGPTHALGRLLTKLDKALTDSNRIGSFNVKYKIGALPPEYGARTDSITYDPATGQFNAVITIRDTAIKYATDIKISQSICHETVHAYLSYLLQRIMTGASYAQIHSLGYPTMFDTYVDSLIGRNQSFFQSVSSSEQYQHNYMANKLLEFFANSLEEFDNDRINNDEYYWYMAWSGLQKSKSWLHFWPNFILTTPVWQTITNPAANDSDKQGFKYALTENRLIDIHNAIDAEQNGTQDALGKKPGAPGSNICYQ